MATRRQDLIDAFATKNAPCCAGCDHWRHFNSVAGECVRTAPVAGADRISMLGMHNASLPAGAGHIMTPRNHVCAEFEDTPAQGATS